MTDVPYSFPGTTPIGEIVSQYGHLGPGEESGATVTAAGRVVLLRRQGKVAFATLRDWTGQIQLFAITDVTESFEALTRLNLGDWVGATGEVVTTRRGELSIKVASWVLLAEARRPFGDKWRGVLDPEVRFRQREVDLWANPGVRERFLLRSRVVKSVRDLMERRGFVEVETPILLPLAGGAHARPFVTHYNALHADFYLRIATELYLKRLIVGGFERVYELGRIFRNEGISPKNNPEFTMLEAYQVYADYLDVAELVEYLVVGIVTDVFGSTSFEYQGRELDVTPPWRKATINEVVHEVTGTEVELQMGVEELRRRAKAVGVEVEDWLDEGEIILEIYEKTTEANLWEPTHVMDYPVSVSPLVRRHRSKPGYAERITPVMAGRELAECYSELVDPDDQRERFRAQMEVREHGDDEAMVLDEEFLRALERGMPPTGGIGFGIDRFVMLLTDVHHIREVLLFPALRPAGGGVGPADDDVADEESDGETDSV